MRGCDFSQCVMIEINLESAMLISCNFNDVNLKNSNLRNTIVSHSSFVGASLYGVQMFRTVAKDCNFKKARLIRADLREGDF